MQDRDGTLVFVEVRKRASTRFGGAAASIGLIKEMLYFAARFYLMRLNRVPPCRFDVICVEPTGVEWLKAAFDAA